MLKCLMIFITIFLTHPAFSFNCFFTFVKSSCWADYEVSTAVIDSNSAKELLNVTIPDGKLWIRMPFECQAGESLDFVASFSPAFWASDKGKTFNSAQRTKLPDTIQATETAWNITVCYPQQFESVPVPPDAKGVCLCDLESIPAPPPQPLKP